MESRKYEERQKGRNDAERVYIPSGKLESLFSESLRHCQSNKEEKE